MILVCYAIMPWHNETNDMPTTIFQIHIIQFNHHYDPEVAISYDQEGNCIAYTTRDISAGSELRISYGYDTNPSALFGEIITSRLFHVLHFT